MDPPCRRLRDLAGPGADRDTRNHEGAGDFPAWLADKRPAPRPTVFIEGNREDFEWLERERAAGRREVLPGITYVPSGDVIDIEADGETIRVGGIGGCHGPSDYERPSRRLQGYARRHFTRDEVERLCEHGGLDVLLLHDAPAGVEFTWRRPDGSVRRRYQSEAEGLAQAVRVRPGGRRPLARRPQRMAAASRSGRRDRRVSRLLLHRCGLELSERRDVVFSRVTYFDPTVDVRQTAYFASFDGGAHWTAMSHPDGTNQKRVPMVMTNRRSYGIDIWVGAGNLFRIRCSLLGIVCPVTNLGAWAEPSRTRAATR